MYRHMTVKNVLPLVVTKTGIFLGKIVSDKDWLLYGGNFTNNQFLDLEQKKEDIFYVDFSRTKWVDPLPLISIILHSKYLQ